MSTMIREIALSGERFKGYTGTDPGNRIEDLNKLNVFIGPNNSGKSRLLRAIFAAKSLEYSTNLDEVEGLRSAIREVKQNLPETLSYLRDNHSFSTKDANEILSAMHCPLFLQSANQDANYSSAAQKYKHMIDGALARFKPSHSVLSGKYGEPLQALRRAIGRIEQVALRPLKFHRIYIPSLRAIRPFQPGGDLCRDRTVADYFYEEYRGSVGKPQMLEDDIIITGQSFYSSVRRFLLGTLQQRKQIREYEVFLSREFFGGESVALIPREGNVREQVLHVKIGSEQEQPIHNLGDGIQQIIIQTLPLVLHADKNLIVCIEEPELYLHPGYQRLLIERFLDTSNCASRQVFVATHSQQFLDMTLDHKSISVYRVVKEKPEEEHEEWTPTFKVSLRSSDDRMVLRELGIHNSSILLANCTIWVEGITDRMYIRHFLELWHKKQESEDSTGFASLQEDIHYAFVEYSGGNITHWSFLDDSGNGMKPEWLCGELFLVADRDKGKDKRHEKLKQYLGDRVHILPCREIENLLTPAVIGAVVQGYEGAGVDLQSFEQNDYRDPPLGKFIHDSVLPVGQEANRKGGYQMESGTIKDKLGFAQRALAEIQSFDELSADAQELTNKIVDFIRERNP